MTKKQKNPFVKAASVVEFLEILRADLERLRGTKFKVWKTSNTWIDDRAMELVFAVDADYTTAEHKYNYTSWADLATGRSSHRFPKRSRLNKWEGYDIDLKHCSGGSGSKSWTGCYTMRLPLKFLPLVAKIVLRNQKITKGESIALETDPQARGAASEEAKWGRIASERRQVVQEEYRAKNPQTDPITGKLRR